MFCRYCNSEIDDNSKFCPQCGHKIEVETILPKEEETQTVSQDTEPVQPVQEERRVWFYIANNETLGGYTESEMLQFIKEGTITKKTYVWREGESDWKYASNSFLGTFFDGPADTVEEPKMEQQETQEETVEESKEWYYADASNNQQGPFTESEMKQFINNGTINANSYVWQPGLQTWVLLKDSNLNGYLFNTTNAQSNQNASVTIPVQNRSIALSIVLSFVTCGIYAIYWLYCIVRDANRIAVSQSKSEVFDAGIAILLSIVTCGLFNIYLYYKMGKTFGYCINKNGYQMEDTSIVMMLLSIFGLSIISMCIAQSQINDCA